MSHSKLSRLLAAVAALLATAVVYTPAAQALPPPCTQYAWSQCDPLYSRGTPEWQACFAQEKALCLAEWPNPYPVEPPTPPFPWPTSNEN